VEALVIDRRARPPLPESRHLIRPGGALRLRTLIVLAAALLLQAACKEEGVGPSSTDGIPLGQWGGNHVGLTITETGASLEFDCAHGTIPPPLAVDDEGRFDLAGTYQLQTPGPERIDQPPTSVAAKYTGKVSGDEIQLTITLQRPGESPQDAGTYTLKRGQPPVLRKCY
jgi:hypothetical protein